MINELAILLFPDEAIEEIFGYDSEEKIEKVKAKRKKSSNKEQGGIWEDLKKLVMKSLKK